MAKKKQKKQAAATGKDTPGKTKPKKKSKTKK